MDNNEGVIISGAGTTITGRNVALGKDARAIENTSAAAGPEAKLYDELKDRLAELQKAIAMNAAQVPNHSEVVSATKAVEAELAQPKPNKLTIRSVLGGVLSVVQSVTGIATAAEGLKAVLARLI